MNETMSGVNGEVTEQLVSYFSARAKGGTGLVTTGAIMATKMASEFESWASLKNPGGNRKIK